MRVGTGLVVGGVFASVLWAQDPSTAGGNGAATFGTTVVIPGGLRGDIYFLDIGTPFLPKFEKLRPVGRIYASELNVSPRNWLEGFPGITTRVEWFAIDYHGRFWVDQPGLYRFSLESDDGSKLYIDEHLVINNDGVHGAHTEEGRTELRAGLHNIRVSYFQGPPYVLGLVLKVARPGGRWRVFSTNDFKPPPNLEDWAHTDAAAQAALTPSDEARHKLGEVAAMAALGANSVPHDFVFHTAVFQFAGLQSGVHCVAVIEIPAASLPSSSHAKDEQEQARFSVLARVKDAGNQVAGQFSEEASGVTGQPLTLSHPLILPPGRYTLEAAVVERGAGRASAAVTSIEITDPSSGIGLSSVMLLRQTEEAAGSEEDPLVHEGRRTVPLLDPVLNGGAAPTAIFFVYPDKAAADKPRVKIELLADGRLAATKEDRLPRADESGTIPMRLKTAGLPGNWELRITVTQGARSVTKSARYSVVANKS
jgi:hypothetical protein